MAKPNTVAEIVADMGPRLRERREALNLSRDEVAKRSGLSSNTIVRYEKGEVGKVAELMALCNALGMTLLDAVDSEHARDLLRGHGYDQPAVASRGEAIFDLRGRERFAAEARALVAELEIASLRTLIETLVRVSDSPAPMVSAIRAFAAGAGQREPKKTRGGPKRE